MGTIDADTDGDAVFERLTERLPLRLAVTVGVPEPPRVRVSLEERLALRDVLPLALADGVRVIVNGDADTLALADRVRVSVNGDADTLALADGDFDMLPVAVVETETVFVSEIELDVVVVAATVPVLLGDTLAVADTDALIGTHELSRATASCASVSTLSQMRTSENEPKKFCASMNVS